MRSLLLASALGLVAGGAMAAGSGSSSPPTPTQTTTCPEGTVYDADAGGCVAPQESGLSDDELFEAVRELAYAGRLDDAALALDAMSEGRTGRVSTYLGFIARKSGDFDLALSHYREAIAADPDDLLARSYMGQGYVAEGDLAAAELQLAEITARGGAGTWPEIALRRAIETGQGASY